MTKNKIEHHEHHHHYSYDWGKFAVKVFFLLILTVLIVNIITVAIEKINEDKNIYYKCVDGCKAKNFMGIREGWDTNPYNPIINEFDRTDCIQNCNYLYAGLNGYTPVYLQKNV